MNRFDRLINHPGRNIALQCIDYICIAATPPSKGGETYTIISLNKTMLRLTAMPQTPQGGLCNLLDFNSSAEWNLGV
jgi:hypothetical protein